MATPFLKQAGVAGLGDVGALYAAPGRSLYQVQGVDAADSIEGLGRRRPARPADDDLRGLSDDELRGFEADDELRGFAAGDDLNGFAARRAPRSAASNRISTATERQTRSTASTPTS